ncbi:hypothetical protein NW762_014288 [Fusarium torreyae]|uniref:Uncharacterized protein n=1 Tax=Fusarium torreyae TaxID=1237075 RepID=A0A9W8RLZ8_9HYPO|nr:hypothetical protein NW762_014288 [Fusarium torreyae]
MISELDDFIAARREKAALLSSKSSSLTNFLNEQQEADTQQTNHRSGCTLERVQEMLIFNPSYLIDRWVAESDSASVPTPSTKSHRDSAHSLSPGARSQMLQDYPALLLYATSELPSHIRLAGTGIGQFQVETIVTKLQEKCNWDRLTALKEDMRSEVDAIDWIERQKVDSAQEEIRRAERRARSRRRKKVVASAQQSEAPKNRDISPERLSNLILTMERPEAAAEQTQFWRRPRNRSRRPRRPRSIASFSSASSYGR